MATYNQLNSGINILICNCGNTEEEEGFFPSNSKGKEVSTNSLDWNGIDLACARCGVIFNQFSFEVVGDTISH